MPLLAAVSAFGVARPDVGADTAALARYGRTIMIADAYVMDLRHSTASLMAWAPSAKSMTG
jgi:hypothetical protein